MAGTALNVKSMAGAIVSVDDRTVKLLINK